jgi:hypothetical protein
MAQSLTRAWNYRFNIASLTGRDNDTHYPYKHLVPTGPQWNHRINHGITCDNISPLKGFNKFRHIRSIDIWSLRDRNGITS